MTWSVFKSWRKLKIRRVSLRSSLTLLCIFPSKLYLPSNEQNHLNHTTSLLVKFKHVVIVCSWANPIEVVHHTACDQFTTKMCFHSVFNFVTYFQPSFNFLFFHTILPCAMQNNEQGKIELHLCFLCC